MAMLLAWRKAAFSLITVLLVQTVAFGQVDDPWLGIWQAVFVDGNTGATLSSTVTITFGNGTYCWSIPNSTYVPCGSAAGNQMIATAVAPGGFLVTVYSTLSGDTITGTLAQRRPSDGFIVDTSTITLTRLPVNLNFSSVAISCGNGYAYQSLGGSCASQVPQQDFNGTSGFGWVLENSTSRGGNGLTRPGGAFIPPAFNGVPFTQAAFLQGPVTMSQSIPGFIAGEKYVLSFYLGSRYANGSNGYDGNQSVAAELDGQVLKTWTLASFTPFTLQTVSFSVSTGGTHTLSFVGLMSGDHTAFLSHVEIKTSTPLGLQLKLSLDHNIINPGVPANYSIPNGIVAGQARATVTAAHGSNPVTDCSQLANVTVSLAAADIPAPTHAHLSPGSVDNVPYPTHPTVGDLSCSNGTMQTTITAGQLSFEAIVKASAPGASDAVQPLRIGLTNLQPLFSISPGVFDVSGITSHPGNGFSGTPGMNAFLNIAAFNISVTQPLTASLSCPNLFPMPIQGISLQSGGLFDACWNGGRSCTNGLSPFAPPHVSHRTGNDVDIGLKSMSDVCKLALQLSIEAPFQAPVPFAVGIYPEKAASPDHTTATHWHVRIPYSSTVATPLTSGKTQKLAAVASAGTPNRPVLANTAFDQTTSQYKYFYSIANVVSEKPIDGFSLQFDQFVSLPTNPHGWFGIAAGSSQGWYWRAIAASSQVNDTGGLPLSTAAMQPGEKIGGFSFENPLPPTIRSFGFHTFTAVPLLDSEFDIEKLSPPASPITGFTIGPRSNTSLSPTAYLDDIAALIAQAFSHGWIDNSGIVTSLGQKLQAVTRALTRGNAKEAANKLRAFMQEVEAQQGKHLTSEAYALLFFNAQYLRAHL